MEVPPSYRGSSGTAKASGLPQPPQMITSSSRRDLNPGEADVRAARKAVQSEDGISRVTKKTTPQNHSDAAKASVKPSSSVHSSIVNNYQVLENAHYPYHLQTVAQPSSRQTITNQGDPRHPPLVVSSSQKKLKPHEKHISGQTVTHQTTASE